MVQDVETDDAQTRSASGNSGALSSEGR
jgi:hypothetical protein